MPKDRVIWISQTVSNTISMEVIKEEKIMSESEEIIRVSLNLYLNNPEHKRVYDILQKQQNKNAFIRDAVIYYNHGFKRESLTREDVRSVIRECLDDKLSEIRIADKEEQMQQKEQGQVPKPIDYDSLKNVF
mgnify:CR=1 FL=1